MLGLKANFSFLLPVHAIKLFNNSWDLSADLRTVVKCSLRSSLDILLTESDEKSVSSVVRAGLVNSLAEDDIVVLECLQLLFFLQ